jgi:hypothetical protein
MTTVLLQCMTSILFCVAGLPKHVMQSYRSYHDARASWFRFATQLLEQ